MITLAAQFRGGPLDGLEIKPTAKFQKIWVRLDQLTLDSDFLWALYERQNNSDYRYRPPTLAVPPKDVQMQVKGVGKLDAAPQPEGSLWVKNRKFTVSTWTLL